MDATHFSIGLCSCFPWNTATWEFPYCSLWMRLFLHIPGIAPFYPLLLLSSLFSLLAHRSSLRICTLHYLGFCSNPVLISMAGIRCFPGSSLLDFTTAPFSFFGSQSQNSFSLMSRKSCSCFRGSPSFILYLQPQISSSCFSDFHSVVFLHGILGITSSPCCPRFFLPLILTCRCRVFLFQTFECFWTAKSTSVHSACTQLWDEQVAKPGTANNMSQ